MDPVKPLISIAGGFRQLAPADLVAMNGALISIAETGASTAKALPDALAGKFDKAGGAIGGSVSVAGSVSAAQAGDTVSVLEDTSAPSNSFRQKFIYSSKNVNGGNDWLFRQVRPSDGAIQDFVLPGAAPGTLWTTGSFDGADGPGSGKKINFRKKQFNVVDYGADPSGAAGSAAATLAAFKGALADIKAQPFGASLVIPSGAFNFGASMEDYALPHGLDVEGSANSWLLFNGLASGANGLGLGVTAGADGRLRVRGLRVIGRNFGSNNAGSLVSLYGSGEGGGVSVNSLWINCDPTCLPVNHLLIKNPASSGNIRGIQILGGGGAFGASGNTTGVAVYSDRLATDVSFHDVYMQAVGTGFRATMAQTQGQYTLEGVAFRDCVLVGVQTGLNAVSGWYAAPGYSWEGGHINAQLYCFRLDNVSYFAIRNANAQLDYNNNPQAIVYGTSCPAIHIAGNRFQIVDQLGTGATKPNIAGVVAGGGSMMWSVTDNIFGGFTPGSSCVVGQNGSSAIFARGNKKFASGSTSGGMLAGTVTDDGGNLIVS